MGETERNSFDKGQSGKFVIRHNNQKMIKNKNSLPTVRINKSILSEISISYIITFPRVPCGTMFAEHPFKFEKTGYQISLIPKLVRNSIKTAIGAPDGN